MRHSTFKKANEAVMKAGQHAYIDRRKKKRVFRRLWITRISAAVKPLGINYSRFIKGVTDKNIALNRKTLSELSIHEPKVFEHIVNIVK